MDKLIIHSITKTNIGFRDRTWIARIIPIIANMRGIIRC